MGILFYLLTQPLNPDNQQPLLRIDDDWLTGSKAEGFQPAAFNGELCWVARRWGYNQPFMTTTMKPRILRMRQSVTVS